MPPKVNKTARTANACRAMKLFGITEGKTKAAVKALLEVYEDNWDFIEADDYKELLNYIVPDNTKQDEERVQPKVKGTSNSKRESKRVRSENKQAPYDATEVIEHPSKRYCTRQQKDQSLSHTKHSESSLRRSAPRIRNMDFIEESDESEDCPPLVRKPRQRHINPQELAVTVNNIDLVPGDRPELEKSSNLICQGNFTNSGGCDVREDVMKYLQVEYLNKSNSMSVPELSQIDVASSPLLKNALISSSSQNAGSDPPDGEVSQKLMEDKCIKSYRTGECGSLAIATNATENKPECHSLAIASNITENKPELITLKEQDPVSKNSGLGSINEMIADQNLIKPIHIPNHITLSCFNGLCSLIGIEVKNMENIYGERAKRLKVSKDQNPSQLCKMEAGGDYHSSLRVIESSAFSNDDITRGEERFMITLENGRNVELPAFFYIAQNLIYNKASVRFTLADISDEDCCSRCHGDCLTSSIPCLCVIANGDECAYTPGGLVKEKFLDECISLKRKPNKHLCFNCNKCQLVRLENGKFSAACKGHISRRFIKECWHKCGCDKSCGNRTVQKGISVKLQVFLTPEGKGWGLRSLEALPKGAFVCEYVGEVVTIDELHERKMSSVGMEHSYPVLLDADWGSQDRLEDEKALCLDSTVYGNVARFINHRCSDATLVDIPVEVETPDHHYYHVALFTTRDVGAMEELTWDYGFAFHDHDYHGKPFRCLCGSPFCRDHHNYTKRNIIYVRRRRKDGNDEKPYGVLDHLAKDVEGAPRVDTQVKSDALMQLEVAPCMGSLREEGQAAPHASRQLEIVPFMGTPTAVPHVAPDPCMKPQVIPSTPGIESKKAMHYLEWESVKDNSLSSHTTCLAKEVADLRAQLEAEKAARKKDQINSEAHRAQLQAVMQQLSALVPGFQVPQAEARAEC